MSGDRDHHDSLQFEHVGTMRCGDRLLICDVRCLPPRFAGLGRGQVTLGAEVEIEPGIWQVLVARGAAADESGGEDEPAIAFVIFAHERDLALDGPLDHAEALALLGVESGRITAIDPALRADEVMQTAVLEAPREQVPCMLRPLEHQPDEEPRGVLLDIDVSGVLELYGGVGEPRSSLFLVVDG